MDVSERRTGSILRVEDLGEQVANKKQMLLGCFLMQKMGAICSSETSANFYRAIRRHITEDNSTLHGF
jgi:hypothetical protein